MNEKIRELAKRAGFAYEPTKDQLWVDGPTEIMISPGLEKFAELVVRECAQVCLSGENKENWRCTDSINKGFSDAVLDHFGVENDR